MKKWVLVFSLLAVVSVVSSLNLFFYMKQAHALEEASQQISLLEEKNQEISSQLEQNLLNSAMLYDHIDSIETDIKAIEADLDELRSSYGDVPGLRASLEELGKEITNIRQKLTEISSEYISASEVMEAAEPFVVYIQASLFSFEVSGSGIIVSSAGHVITNYHVVEGMRNISATLNTGETMTLELLDYHAGRDIAILKLVTDRDDLSFALLGDSDSLSVGTDVLAIGYPFPLDDIVPGRAAVTRGVVSAIRKIDGYNYIQTDTAINPGNSGGALMNFAGELVGVNVAKYVDIDIEGVGLAIPINEVKSIISEYAG
ncbi:MAG: trypsin-like peptidase domain-containing protein [Dehalococcoidales bacterium]|nr:trypsin-like peptidase domain-containing protein [Dehalococcoidales bacterium]MDD4230876.1 trypsin-like peptidase domain-containing protein [Dehalococcoidales bacterium]MDD4465782.1 trypsin-like peptidase domain-containing protein [Dehalococcoidales bacterium]MDD5402806.1 trypsin-like peptidase domain-containing protein [Dehalococcoidales bacterium]